MNAPRYSAARKSAPTRVGGDPVYTVSTPRGPYDIEAVDGATALGVAREMCERDLEADAFLAQLPVSRPPALEQPDEMRARIETLTRELEKARATGWCDACAGEGTPISGRRCMCGGTGQAQDAVCYLRDKLFAAERELADARRGLSPELAAKLTHMLEWLDCAPDGEHGFRTLCIEVGVDASKRVTVQLSSSYRYEPTLLRDGDGETVAAALGALEIPRAVRPRTLGYRRAP